MVKSQKMGLWVWMLPALLDVAYLWPIQLDDCYHIKDCSPQPDLPCQLSVGDCNSVLLEQKDYPSPPEQFQAELQYSADCTDPHLKVSWIPPNNVGAKIVKGFLIKIVTLGLPSQMPRCLVWSMPTANWTSENYKSQIEFSSSCVRLSPTYDEYQVTVESLPRKAQSGTDYKDCRKTLSPELRTRGTDGICAVSTTTTSTTRSTTSKPAVTNAVQEVMEQTSRSVENNHKYIFIGLSILVAALVTLFTVTTLKRRLSRQTRFNTSKHETNPDRTSPPGGRTADFLSQHADIWSGQHVSAGPSADSGVGDDTSCIRCPADGNISIPSRLMRDMIAPSEDGGSLTTSQMLHQISMINDHTALHGDQLYVYNAHEYETGATVESEHYVLGSDRYNTLTSSKRSLNSCYSV